MPRYVDTLGTIDPGVPYMKPLVVSTGCPIVQFVQLGYVDAEAKLAPDTRQVARKRDDFIVIKLYKSGH